MNDLGLDYSLKDHLRSSSRNTLMFFGAPLGADETAQRQQQILKTLGERTGWFTGSEVRYGSLPDLTYAEEGQPIPTGPFRTVLTLQTMSGLDDHVRLLDGRLPGPSDDISTIEVGLTAEAATFLNAGIGDTCLAAHAVDDCNRPPPTDDPEELRERARFRCIPQVFVTLQAKFTVVGIFDARDLDEPYWAAGRRPAELRPAGRNRHNGRHRARGPVGGRLLQRARAFVSRRRYRVQDHQLCRRRELELGQPRARPD
jgi:hypothetical protein